MNVTGSDGNIKDQMIPETVVCATVTVFYSYLSMTTVKDQKE